jgi:hypothetical protein
MVSYAKELQTIYNDKRSELSENKDVSFARRNNDIKVFFETHVKQGAKEKMMARASVGRPTANIIDYSPQERFYVNEENVVIRYSDAEVNYPNYRIHDIVSRDFTFKAMLKEFEGELSCEECKLTFSCWKPSSVTYVIEAIWGRNRYHAVQKMSEDEDAPVIRSDRGKAAKGGRGGRIGRTRGGRSNTNDDISKMVM